MRIEQLLHNTPEIPPDKNIKKAAKEFEAYFVSYLLKVMRESVPKSGLLSGGMSENIYTSMMDEKIAEGIALQGGFGLSKLLEGQINIYPATADKMSNYQGERRDED